MISLDYVNSILKSKVKSSIFSSCLFNPACSIEIAMKIYGSTKNYQDRNVSKILNELRSNGLLEEVDYEKYKIYKYCDKKRANHFYITDEIFEDLVKSITKRVSGRKKLPIQAQIMIKNIMKDRKTFLEFMMNNSNLKNFSVKFEGKRGVNLKVNQ